MSHWDSALIAEVAVALQGASVYQCDLILSKVSIPCLRLGQALSCLLFPLFLLLSSIPVLYSLLLSDTLENVTLVAPLYQALKTETTPWFFSFIYYLVGQAFERHDHC